MVSLRAGQVLLLLSTLAITPAFASRTHRAPTSGHSRTATSKKAKKKQVHGQRTIDSDRASEIQNALIRQKYLTGAPSGQWDAQTQVAMRQYQSDHGWQTKLTPDSRALISLGLGPNHTTDSPVGHSTPSVQAPNAQEAQSTEPIENNTLASVHSLSQ
jgi:Putative peptidoglycan binding domain